MVEGLQPTTGLSAVKPPAGRFVPRPLEAEPVKDPVKRAPDTLYAREDFEETPETLKPFKDVQQIPKTIETNKDIELQTPSIVQTQEEERWGNTPERLDFALDFQFKGVQFRAIDNPPVVQTRIYDRMTREVLREVPTADELRVARAFRENLSDYIGRYIDAAT